MDGKSITAAVDSARPTGKRLFTIALTGGPCAGKTTLLGRLEQLGSIAGHKLIFVPEAATMLVHRGLVIGEDVVHFQTETMRLQFELEQTALQEAETAGRPCAIICDRGTLDGAGYCSKEEFDAIAASFGESQASLAKHYDLVLHLVSAAVEAPGAYTTENNDARVEKSLEAAIAQEHRTIDAWQSHPNRVIVGSSDSFEHKIQQAIQVITRALEQSC